MRMPVFYDPNAPKQATNLTVNRDLLRIAKALDIRLSTVMEQALEAAVKRKLAEQWLAENADAVSSYNELVERVGVFSDSVRMF